MFIVFYKKSEVYLILRSLYDKFVYIFKVVFSFGVGGGGGVDLVVVCSVWIRLEESGFVFIFYGLFK